MYLESYNEKGLIALVTILIISAVSLFAVLSAALSGIGEAQLGVAHQKSSQALYLATACAEDALLRLKNNFSYTLAVLDTMMVDGGSCDIVSITGTTQKEIRTKATTDAKTRRIKILVSKPALNLVIDSWQEVGDF